MDIEVRNLYAGQEATVRTGHGTMDWLEIGKGVCQGCILSPCLFNLNADYIVWNAGLDKAQAGIKTAGRNNNNQRDADDTTLREESEEELKSPLMKVKEESEKAGLKFNIQKTKIMASDPITWQQIDGETVSNFILLGSKITGDGDYSHEIKRHLLLERKAMTKLGSILKSRDITLLTKVHLVKAVVFPVILYEYELDHKEIWVPKNWCFWIVVLEKALLSPLDCKEIKPVNPKEISPESSLEGLILKLKLQYFGHLMGRTDSLEKTLMLGKIEGGGEGDNRGWDGGMVSSTWWPLVWASGDGQGSLMCCSPRAWKESDTTEWLNWTDQAKKSYDFTVKHLGGKWNFLAQFIHLTHWTWKWQKSESVSSLSPSYSFWCHGL